jgi:hypothetical protein
MNESRKKVILLDYGIDTHRTGCNCGSCCISTGNSYKVGIYPVPDDIDDNIFNGDDFDIYTFVEKNREDVDKKMVVIYASSEQSAFHNAKMYCHNNGLDEVFINRITTPAAVNC